MRSTRAHRTRNPLLRTCAITWLPHASSEADNLLEAALAIERAAGDHPGVVQALTLRGAVALDRGDRKRSASVLVDALDAAELYGTQPRIARVLDVIADLLVQEHPDAAIQCAASAQDLRRIFGAAPLRHFRSACSSPEHGLSNREIAQQLVVTLKTVEVHTTHILTKLNLTNRVQIATWGLRYG
jgi:hypothetical protein